MPVRLSIAALRGLAGVIALLIHAGCASPSTPGRKQVAAKDCVNEQNLDGLTVYFSKSNGLHYFRFNSGQLTTALIHSGRDIAAKLPRNDYGTNDFNKFEDAFGSHQYNIKNLRLSYPAQVSPNKEWLAAALQDKSRMEPTPVGFIIKNLNNNHQISIHPEWDLVTLTWGPNSDRLAILEKQIDKIPKSPRDLFTGLFGFAASYDDVALSIFSLSGNLICRTVLLKNSPETWLRLKWD